MQNIKKYLAELIGTFVLVLFGCGAAVMTANVVNGEIVGVDIITTSLAFGLTIIAMAYSIGQISGCHLNPAVSTAMLLNKRMTISDFFGYVVAQFIGGILGAATLFMFVSLQDGPNEEVLLNGLGANSFGNMDWYGAFIIEVILTFVFVLVILMVTSKKGEGKLAGIVIGLTLTMVHIVGIPLTGTSVNPARSFGPALLVGGDALSQVWVFLLAPIVGAIIAAVVCKFCFKTESED